MKKKTYKFEDRIFKSEEHTIRYLNYALALNNRAERYVEVKQKRDEHEASISSPQGSQHEEG